MEIYDLKSFDVFLRQRNRKARLLDAGRSGHVRDLEFIRLNPVSYIRLPTLLNDSGTLAKLLVVVCQDISVPYLVVVNILDSFCASFFANGYGLNPTLDFLLGSEIKHCKHFCPVADV